MSTDVVGSPVREVQLMARGRLSPMDAIVAATRNGVELIDIEARIDTIEMEKLADLILVDGKSFGESTRLGQGRVGFHQKKATFHS
jgi:imidazolonepropionase-like amidohydrolase